LLADPLGGERQVPADPAAVGAEGIGLVVVERASNVTVMRGLVSWVVGICST